MVIDPELPCLSCSHWNAVAAMREIAAAYLQLRRGERPVSAVLGGGVLPASCCRRRVGIPPVTALIA
jgi:hypothetical protein